jgi:hypothetical protein
MEMERWRDGVVEVERISILIPWKGTRYEESERGEAQVGEESDEAIVGWGTPIEGSCKCLNRLFVSSRIRFFSIFFDKTMSGSF